MLVFRTLTAVLTGALAATAFIAATATSTVADSASTSRLVLRDGPGDVWKVSPRTEEQTQMAFPRADVTRAVLRHGPAALTVRMRFVDLKPVGRQLYWVHIRTPRYQYDAVLSSSPGSRRGSRYFQGDDGSRSCRGFTRHIYYGRDLVTMRLPRRCVNNPRWVRLGIFDQLSFRAHGPRYFDTPLNHESPASDATQTRRLYVSKP